jgi:hypothetical protein
MASGLKPSSARTHSARSAYQALWAWATWPTTGLADRRTRCTSARSARSKRVPWHGSPMAKPWQDVHHKIPQPTVHSPDTIESPSSQRGRRTIEGWNSPARSTEPELNGGEGAGPSGWGAALGSSQALGPTYGERGGVRWLGTNEVVENRGEARPGWLTGGRQWWGRGQMNGRGLLL